MSLVVGIIIALLVGVLVVWIAGLLIPHTIALVLGILAGVLVFFRGVEV